MLSSVGLLSLILSLNIFTFEASAQYSTNCQQSEVQNVNLKACVRIPEAWDQKAVLYHLHGSGGDARSWDRNPYYQQVIKNFQNQKLQLPAVVSISFGSFWFLKDFSLENGSTFLEVFLKTQQEVELEILNGKKPERRILVGESMGAFNALLLMAKSQLKFDKIAFMCPGFAVVGPYSSQEEVQSYINRNKPYIDERLVYGILGALKEEFPTEVSWSHHAPMQMTQYLKSQEGRFFIMGNTQDEYGFGEGADLMRSKLQALGLKVQYESVVGRHCVMNASRLTQFLK